MTKSYYACGKWLYMYDANHVLFLFHYKKAGKIIPTHGIFEMQVR
jgi:hypothetical protein